MNLKTHSASIKMSLLALLAVTFLSGCESDEDRLLAEAEACINRATAANVSECVAKVAGMESEDAYLIRCSADFITQGFTDARLVSAFQDISNSGSVGGATPTTAALAYLAFNNSASVTAALNNCQRSGAQSLIRVLKLVEVATTFSSVAPGFNPATATPADMKNAITNFLANSPAPNGQDETTVGNLAVNLRQEFCVNNTSFTSTDVCDKMNQAFTAGGGNPQTIGQQLLTLLQQ